MFSQLDVHGTENGGVATVSGLELTLAGETEPSITIGNVATDATPLKSFVAPSNSYLLYITAHGDSNDADIIRGITAYFGGELRVISNDGYGKARLPQSNFHTFSARICQISLPRSWKTMHYSCRYLARSCKKMSGLARSCTKISDLGSNLEEIAWSWKYFGRNCLILKVFWKNMSDLGSILEENAWSWKKMPEPLE